MRVTGEWLRHRDWIDADRVAVYGHSYGGYAVYVRMTRFPGAWAAGVAYNGYPGGWEGGYAPVEHTDPVVDPLLLLVGNMIRCWRARIQE